MYFVRSEQYIWNFRTDLDCRVHIIIVGSYKQIYSNKNLNRDCIFFHFCRTLMIAKFLTRDKKLEKTEQ